MLPTTRTRTRALLASAFALVLVVAITATAALAAPQVKPPSSGSWLGRTTQDISLAPDKPWSVLISVTAFHGRLSSIATTIRTECPGPTIRDIRILKSYGRSGPPLTATGSFAVRVSGVSISGGLQPGGAAGHFRAIGGGCKGTGSWKAKRTT